MNNKIVANNPEFAGHIKAFVEKMKGEGLDEAVISFFLSLYEQFIQKASGTYKSGIDIIPVDKESIVSSESLCGDAYAVAGLEAMKKTAIIKLNGGLGTSMGLDKAKSLLKVKDNQTFLDITVDQVKKLREQSGVNIPLLFMDSFSTDEDTLKYLDAHHQDFKNENLEQRSFLQNKFPKIDADTKMPAHHSQEELNWNPPGHGDLYITLRRTGIMDKLLKQGIKYVIVSNVDNLCAGFDVNTAGYMAINRVPFIMEVAQRGEADKKGGHLGTSVITGGLMLREAAQCPAGVEDKKDFQDIKKWEYFNTNTIWLDLEEVDKLMNSNGGLMPLGIIINSKDNNPQEVPSPSQEDKMPVKQLETAMGSAIALFSGSKALLVKTEDRFAPTKKASDLLLIRSDAYTYKKGRFFLSTGKKPVVLLNDELYKSEADINGLTLEQTYIPSVKNVAKLEIDGNSKVLLREKLILEGNVRIINNSGKVVVIDNSFINKLKDIGKDRKISNTEIIINESSKVVFRKL